MFYYDKLVISSMYLYFGWLKYTIGCVWKILFIGCHENGKAIVVLGQPGENVERLCNVCVCERVSKYLINSDQR